MVKHLTKTKQSRISKNLVFDIEQKLTYEGNQNHFRVIDHNILLIDL